MGSLSAERSYQEHQSVVRRLGLSPKMNSADESSAQDFEEMDLIIIIIIIIIIICNFTTV